MRFLALGSSAPRKIDNMRLLQKFVGELMLSHSCLLMNGLNCYREKKEGQKGLTVELVINLTRLSVGVFQPTTCTGGKTAK